MVAAVCKQIRAYGRDGNGGSGGGGGSGDVSAVHSAVFCHAVKDLLLLLLMLLLPEKLREIAGYF